MSASSSGGALIPIKLLSLDHISSSGSGGAGWLARLLCPLTDALLSPSSGLLARNLFMGYMFGRVVDNTEGGTALVGTFVLSALGERLGSAGVSTAVSHDTHAPQPASLVTKRCPLLHPRTCN